MKKVTIVLLYILLVSFCLTGQDFSSGVKSFTLDNGMRFFVYERSVTPTFAGMIMVKVGSSDEKVGQTGLAHFFEHMAFKGTPVIGAKNYEQEKILLERIARVGQPLYEEYRKGNKADREKVKLLKTRLNELQQLHRKSMDSDSTISKIYAQNGGKGLNATTNRDTTQFFLKLPANRLELWFLMESERFKYPVFREFYMEKEVVLEETRSGSENDPDGLLIDQFFHVAFFRHPYRHPTTGYKEDLYSTTQEEAVNFYKTYYVPGNMAVAVVGDVKLEQVRQLAEKYFGDIPAGQLPPKLQATEPVQRGERRFEVQYEAEPRVMIGYRMPAYPSRDSIILEVIHSILAGGESSRLYKDLVLDRKLANTVFTTYNFPAAQYPNIFLVYFQANHSHSCTEVEQEIYAHLERLKTEPVSQKEIEKAINQRESSFYSGLEDPLSIAREILWGILLFNNIDVEFKKMQEMRKITPQDIMKTSARIFTASNRTVGTLVKKKKGGNKK